MIKVIVNVTTSRGRSKQADITKIVYCRTRGNATNNTGKQCLPNEKHITSYYCLKLRVVLCGGGCENPFSLSFFSVYDTTIAIDPSGYGRDDLYAGKRPNYKNARHGAEEGGGKSAHALTVD